MKARNLSLVVLVLVTLITFSNYIRGHAGEEHQDRLPAVPPVPEPTHAPEELEKVPDPSNEPTAIPLAKPLESPEEVLQQLSVYDAHWAVWEEPWGVDTLTAAPDRIIIESFPSRAEESKAMGFDEWFHPSIEANAGSVWSIIIKGNVHLNLIGSGVDGPVAAEGVNYVISARTGNLLTIRGGIPDKYK